MSHVCALSQLLQQTQQASEGLSSLMTPLHLSIACFMYHLHGTCLVSAAERTGASLGFGSELYLMVFSSKRT